MNLKTLLKVGFGSCYYLSKQNGVDIVLQHMT